MSFKLTIGRVATLAVPAFHNEAIISIYPRSGVDQRYLGYYLSQVDYEDHQDRQIKGNTLNQAKIDQIQVALPPTEVQTRIADVLDRCRQAIEVERSASKLTQELKEACMADLFSKGLRGEEQRETEIGSVPGSWGVTTLGSVAKLSTGTTPSTKDARYYAGSVPFIKTADVVNNRIRTATTFVSDHALNDYSLSVYPAGTLLMAMYGQGKTRGQVSLLEIEATTTQNAAAIQPYRDCDSTFLWHYLMSCYQRLRGMGSLGHVSHLNLGYLRDLPILMPSLDEQREIASILDALHDKASLHRQKEAVLEELFEALLTRLMTGEIDVNDLDLSALQPAT